MKVTIPVGSERTPEPVEAVRDPRQREAVAAIMAEPGFAFACTSPFSGPVGTYCGPFLFTWFTEDGLLHTVRVSKNGTIMLRIDATEPVDISPVAQRYGTTAPVREGKAMTAGQYDEQRDQQAAAEERAADAVLRQRWLEANCAVTYDGDGNAHYESKG